MTKSNQNKQNLYALNIVSHRHCRYVIEADLFKPFICRQSGCLTSPSFINFKYLNCVFLTGKWMYEVMLWSKGVMQLGWCTIKCKFSFEEGVGDTQDSYSYDGSRLRKWNIRTQKYGEVTVKNLKIYLLVYNFLYLRA